jgi:hypothetical protein
MEPVRQFEGTVVMLQCHHCRAVFPHFVFSGETDMETQGLRALTVCAQNRVVIAEETAADLKASSDRGADGFRERMFEVLGRTDLCVVELLRTERAKSGPKPVSFQEFRKHYHPPKVIYSCCCCAGGEAETSDRLSVSEFRARGGELQVIGSLELVE